MEIRHVTTIRLGIDDGHERRAADMLARWHGPDELTEQDDRGRNLNAGYRALNTLRDRSAVTGDQLRALVDYCATLETWAHTEIGEYADLADLGDRSARVIVESRIECLEDIAEFRDSVLLPGLDECAKTETLLAGHEVAV